MSLNAKQVPMAGGGGGSAPVLDPGTYPARLVQVILMGIQPQRPYQGEDKPPALELYTTYELLDEFMKDEEGNDIEDKPRWLSESFPFHNLKAEKAKSTLRYFSLDPRGTHDGEWSELLSSPVMLTIINREGKGVNAGKQYNNIASTSAMRDKEAAKAPDLVNPAKLFNFYEPDKEVFDSLPEWLQEKIKGAVDYDGSDLQALIEGEEKPADKPKDKAPKKKFVPEEEDDQEVEW